MSLLLYGGFDPELGPLELFIQYTGLSHICAVGHLLEIRGSLAAQLVEQVAFLWRFWVV